jgi:hypothetical protein
MLISWYQDDDMFQDSSTTVSTSLTNPIPKSVESDSFLVATGEKQSKYLKMGTHYCRQLDNAALDWALISLDAFEFNKNEFNYEIPHTIATQPPEVGRKVILATSRGKITTRSIGSSSLVNVESLSTMLSTWTLAMTQESLVEDGDCGSWATDAVTGELVGVLVARCNPLLEVYIVPAKDIFDDIETLMGERPQLPVSVSQPAFVKRPVA